MNIPTMSDAQNEINALLSVQLDRLARAFPKQRVHVCFCTNGIQQSHWEAYAADAGYSDDAATPDQAISALIDAEPVRVAKKRDELKTELARVSANLKSIEAELAAQEPK